LSIKTLGICFIAGTPRSAFCFGGDDGNRTHVRKPLDKTFSVGSLLFRIPFGEREQTRYPLGSPFLLDRLKSEPPMQVHCSDDVQSAVAVLGRGTGDPQVTALPSFTPKRKTQAAIAT